MTAAPSTRATRGPKEDLVVIKAREGLRWCEGVGSISGHWAPFAAFAGRNPLDQAYIGKKFACTHHEPELYRFASD